MPNDGVQIDRIEGDTQISQIGGDVQGDLTGRDKSVYNIRHLTIYTTSVTQEPEQPAPASDFGPNPYKGLSTFTEDDAERFFGRGQLIEELWQKFYDLHEATSGPSPRFLSIIGPSGSGKSSVARAGLLPELKRRPLPGMRQGAYVVILQPGEQPLRALAKILARIAANDPSPAAKTREFAEELALKNAENSYDGLYRIAEVLPNIERSPLIVLVDQCEELYTSCQNNEQCTAFIDNLLHAASARTAYVSVILTLRSDFLGHTQSHPEFNHAIAANEIIVPVMTDAELHDAIAKPAEHAGHPLKEGTIRLLIEQSEGREGALPLLQFALERIWEEMAKGIEPADTLQQIGGVGGALANKSQEIYENLDAREKTIARRAFLEMISLGEGSQDTRRRVLLSRIVAQGEEPQQVHAVLQRFSKQSARLITLSAGQEGGDTMSEVTHEALITHWKTLRDWLDSSRDDLRFHRRSDEAARHWERQKRPDGLLWRPPDLDLLRQYHTRAGQDMTPLQVEFFEASVRKERHSKRVRRIAVTALVVLAVIAMGAAGVALWAYKDARRQSRISLIRSVVAYAYKEDAQNERERAALLARQASILNERFHGNVDDQIEDALQTIFRTSTIEAGYGHAATGAELLEMVCQNVDTKKALIPDEWKQFLGEDIEHELACPDMPDVLQLRTETMTTTDMEALSLNLHQDSSYGYPIEYIKNDFEDWGDVIFDHATGLMWQQSGSQEDLVYPEALEYIEQLNREKFGGYDNWRLPTVEELLSLLEKEQISDGRYIDPMFDAQQSWVWSGDLRQIKDEGSAGPAWRVSFYYGLVDRGDFRIECFVRCVRS